MTVRPLTHILLLTLSVLLMVGADDQEIDLGQMLQMGLNMGKQYLGEEGMDKLKKGDFSQLVELGEKFLGEGAVNDILTAAAKEFIKTEDQPVTEQQEEEVRFCCFCEKIFASYWPGVY